MLWEGIQAKDKLQSSLEDWGTFAQLREVRDGRAKTAGKSVKIWKWRRKDGFE